MQTHVLSESKLTLEAHLLRVDVFKIGLRNSFQIDFRTARRLRPSNSQESQSQLFHFLGEVLPLVEPRTRSLSKTQRKAYEDLREKAEESFWQIYSDFQPMVRSIASASGVETDSLDSVLGRALLLYDASRKSSFVTYLEKSLRESVKNLRGKRYADELGIPLSAGRLVPQLLWTLDQAAMERRTSLSVEESESIVIRFLQRHRTRFSESSMQRIATVLRSFRNGVSLDTQEVLEPSTPQHSNVPGNDCYVEYAEECGYQLTQIMDAISRAELSEQDASLVLHRLDLPHNERLYGMIASKVTESSLRKRKQRLLVRLLASRYAPQSTRFGRFLNVSASKSRPQIIAELVKLSEEWGASIEDVVADLLNWMALTESVYRISIVDRQRLGAYLLEDHGIRLATPVFQKLKAALIEQDRLDFPCLRE